MASVNEATLRDLLSSLPSDQWRCSPVCGDGGRQVCWLPITMFTRQRYAEGLSKEGVWVGETAEGVALFEPGGWFVRLLPVLEHSPQQAMEILHVGLQRVGLPPETANTFPFDEVIACGLSSNDYWIGHALNWLEDGPPKPQLTDQLSNLARQKQGVSQSHRHQALRLLSRWNKTSGAEGSNKTKTSQSSHT